MNAAQVLNVVIPAVILGYGVYLVVRLFQKRRRGCSCGGCSGCPMADGCRLVQKKEKKERESDEP